MESILATKMARLVLISGAPGVGKSTLAIALAKIMEATYLDKDSIDEAFSPGDRGKRYARDIEPKVIQALLNLAVLNLRPGHTVIIDLPWTHLLIQNKKLVAAVKKCVKRQSAQLTVLECFLPTEEQLRERLQKRRLKRDLPKLTASGWKKFLANDRVGAKNPLPHVKIDLSLKHEACVDQAISILLQPS